MTHRHGESGHTPAFVWVVLDYVPYESNFVVAVCRSQEEADQFAARYRSRDPEALASKPVGDDGSTRVGPPFSACDPYVEIWEVR